ARPQGSGYDRGAYEYATSGYDIIPPQISNINLLSKTPLDIEIGWENITCTVTDNVAVNEVILHLTNPERRTTSLSMQHRPGTSLYYYRTTLTLSGNYSYQIWARDTNNNEVSSAIRLFSLPPNWDINMDGRCTILDQVLLSVHYSEAGTNGWIRQDVDNNGVINNLDLILTSNHYGESW
ncbi:MAG: hypothetical protein NTW30_04170, partial [Candidatus Aenigmarchaeota archaeon]|nr:hypothetical protein [Candidatus Aenigmarchaeota archaeon]